MQCVKGMRQNETCDCEFCYALGKEPQSIPPFVEAYQTIMIDINFVKELVYLPLRYYETCSLKSHLQFAFVELSISVAVDRVEKCEQFFLGVLDKGAEF